MESIDFARKTAVAVLRNLELPQVVDVSNAPDDSPTNAFARHFIANAGLIKIDIIITACAPKRWIDATVSVETDCQLWQRLVQTSPGGTLQIYDNFNPRL